MSPAMPMAAVAMPRLCRDARPYVSAAVGSEPTLASPSETHSEESPYSPDFQFSGSPKIARFQASQPMIPAPAMNPNTTTEPSVCE
jgi:hypothetical protein